MQIDGCYIVFDDGSTTEPGNIVMDCKIDEETIEITMDDFITRTHKGNYDEYKELWFKWWERV